MMICSRIGRVRLGLTILVSCAVVGRSAAATEAAPTGSSSERSLTLGEAIAWALRQNPALAARVADVTIAEARWREAQGAEDFVFTTAATGSTNRGENASWSWRDDVPIVASLSRLLPTGGTLRLAIGAEYTRPLALSGTDAETAPIYQPWAQLTLTQPLLRGFGVNVTRANRQRAQIDTDVANHQRRAAAADLVRVVVQAYWELALATIDLRVREAAVAQARAQLEVVQANIAVGKQPASATAEIEVAIAFRENDVHVARQRLQEQSLTLQQLLALDVDASSPGFIAADPLEPHFASVDLQTALARAKDNNPQLRAALAAGAAAAIDVEVTENGLLPQLDFTIGGGPLGRAETPRQALLRASHFDAYQAQASIIFSFAVERNTALGRVAAARAGAHKARLSAAAIAQQVAAGVQKAFYLMSSVKQRVEVLAKATDLASLDLAAEQARFHVGRATNFDILRRQDELAQARLYQARAKVDYLEAEAVLESLTGDILTHFGVELSEKDL